MPLPSIAKYSSSHKPDVNQGDLLFRFPADKLAQAIDLLAPKKKVHLSLVYFEELSLPEIAKVLGTTVLEVTLACEEALAEINAWLEHRDIASQTDTGDGKAGGPSLGALHLEA